MRVVALRDDDCRSFIVISGSEAVVVDPTLAASEYARAASPARIVAVAETHVHSDHASRARELADAAWCPLFLPANARVLFAHQPLRDGATMPLSLVARAAPGHTAESMCYHGDGFVLLGDALEPPDVDASPLEAKLRAATQHGTLLRLLELPDATRVLAAHADETTIGPLRASLDLADRARFVDGTLARRSASLERVRMRARNVAGIPPDAPPPLSKRP